MSPPRLHVAGLRLAVGATSRLSHATTRHALRALRLRPGDAVTLFDGCGGEYAARLVVAREPEAEVQVVAFDAREAELPWRIVVGQGLSSGDRMDRTVEKCVELGAAAIAPLAMARSVLRLSGARADTRVAHWRSIAIAASEQCGRNRVTDVADVASLDAWLAALPTDALALALAPDGARLSTVPRPARGRDVVVVAGPEGGFDAAERDAMRRAGLVAVSLGPRVLRTETAAPAALAMLAALWDADADASVAV